MAAVSFSKVFTFEIGVLNYNFLIKLCKNCMHIFFSNEIEIVVRMEEGYLILLGGLYIQGRDHVVGVYIHGKFLKSVFTR